MEAANGTSWLGSVLHILGMYHDQGHPMALVPSSSPRQALMLFASFERMSVEGADLICTTDWSLVRFAQGLPKLPSFRVAEFEPH